MEVARIALKSSLNGQMCSSALMVSGVWGVDVGQGRLYIINTSTVCVDRVEAGCY